LPTRRQARTFVLQNDVEVDMRRAVAALGCRAPPGVIDQNPAHHLRGNAIELRATFPIHLLLVDDAQECFMDQCRALQSVRAALVTQMAARQRA
jgi:hypothetical protein